MNLYTLGSIDTQTRTSTTSTTITQTSTSSTITTSTSSATTTQTSTSSTTTTQTSTSSTTTTQTSTSSTTTTQTSTSSMTQTQTNPAVVPSVGKYKTIGCYVDNIAGNAINPNKGALLGDDALTVEICAAFCSDYFYFGVEFARECYCGDSLEYAVFATSGNCNTPCGGVPDEICGGANRINIYIKTDTTCANAAILDPGFESTVIRGTPPWQLVDINLG
jgi:hypothetical protein